MKTTNVFDYIRLILNNINTHYYGLQGHKLLQKELPNTSTTFTDSFMGYAHKMSSTRTKQTSLTIPQKRSILFAVVYLELNRK